MEPLKENGVDSELIEYAKNVTIFSKFPKPFQPSPMEIFQWQSVCKLAIELFLGSWRVAQRPGKAAICYPVVAIRETIFGQNIQSKF